mmetsp:Transcript_53601/g.135376  ORF Transcript_53601/g.135376 Transcript_53601/m.135376 type:complete len:200 (-) Transcript_53601:162-761(-)
MFATLIPQEEPSVQVFAASLMLTARAANWVVACKLLKTQAATAALAAGVLPPELLLRCPCFLAFNSFFRARRFVCHRPIARCMARFTTTRACVGLSVAMALSTAACAAAPPPIALLAAALAALLAANHCATASPSRSVAAMVARPSDRSKAAKDTMELVASGSTPTLTEHGASVVFRTTPTTATSARVVPTTTCRLRLM